MKLRILDAEGTPKELADFYSSLGESGSSLMQHAETQDSVELVPEIAPSGHVGAKQDQGGLKDHQISVRVAKLALARRPLSPQVKAVLKLLSEAYPQLVPASRLKEVTGYSGAQLAGLLGAFGRRLVNTRGFVEGTDFWRYSFDHSNNTWHYGLWENSKEAVNQAGLA